MPLAFDDLTSELLRRFPELVPAYEKERQWAGDTLEAAHVAYGDLLNPYLIVLLEAGDRPDLLRRIFNFLEELANHPATIVQEVVALTVVERLTDREDWLTAAWPFMGPKVRQFAKEVAEYWGTSRGFPFS